MDTAWGLPEPLPYGSGSARQLREDLAIHGYARLRNVFPLEEVNHLRHVVDQLVSTAPESEFVWRSPAELGELVVQRISRANLLSNSVHACFQMSPQLALIGSWVFGVPMADVKIADGLEGSDGVVLVIKHPANQSVHRNLRWHRDDKFTSHLPINPFVNCGLYLDRADSVRGGLLIIPGGHRSDAYDTIDETTREVPEQVCVAAGPGDVVVHRDDIWHRSGPHEIQGEQRRVLYANIYTS
jgi:ectoine hydroxylase-related dioxygenase (phytanoyl-CoA dioxygenase family)